MEFLESDISWVWPVKIPLDIGRCSEQILAEFLSPFPSNTLKIPSPAVQPFPSQGTPFPTSVLTLLLLSVSCRLGLTGLSSPEL